MRWGFFFPSLFVIWFTHSASTGAVTERLGGLQDEPAAFKEKETARSVSVNCDKGSHICAATQLAKTRCNIWLRTRSIRDWRSSGVEKRGHSSPGWSPAGPKQTVDMCHPLLTWWGSRLAYKSHPMLSIWAFSLPFGQTVELIHRLCVQTCCCGNISKHVKTCTGFPNHQLINL